VRVLVPPLQDAESWKMPYLDYMRALKQRFEVQQREPRQVDVLALTEKVLANSLLPYELPDTPCPPYWRLPERYLATMCEPAWRPDQPRA
jgi:hypothetical protein